MKGHLLNAAVFALLGIAVAGAPAMACTADPECDDGLTCNGTETCNVGTMLCEPGVPLADFVICDDGDDCTVGDTCQMGVCQGGPGADSDGDGDCDAEETDCGCNPNDEKEVCHLPNRLVGRIGGGPGEVLMEWYSPMVRRVEVATDDACAMVGQCVAKRCAKGKVRDVCAVDADCDQPPLTCRLIVDWADHPDIVLDFATVGGVDVPGFLPASHGCSRKADVEINPDRSSRIRFRASGTVDGRLRRDRDAFRFRP